MHSDINSKAANTAISSLNTLFIGPASANAAPTNFPTTANSTKASLRIKQAISHMLQAHGEHEHNDPATVLAEAPSCVLLPELREIFNNPDRAARKGHFTCITAENIDLPPPRNTPSPSAANLWISHLPPHIAHVFDHQFNTFFVQPLEIYVKTGTETRTLPPPRTHATPQHYRDLLKRAESAGMLRWSLVHEEDEEYSHFADAIQLTLFAVSKTQKRTRLISWPRVQNDALPDPPHTYLPDPSLFEAIEVNGHNLSACYFDIANMFHNLTIPIWLTKLFPMEPVYARDLDQQTLDRIKKQIPHWDPNSDHLIRPYQVTIPMGFKWAVFIAHSFVAGCLERAYKLFKSSRFALPDIQIPHTLHAECAPFLVSPNKPLILHIIDDVTFVTTGWPDAAMTAWHKITRQVLALNRLPISDKKSSRLDTVEKNAITFIGCRWDFSSMLITPSPDKRATAIQNCSVLVRATTATTDEWQRIIVRLVWIATLNRPLLPCMQRIFRSTLSDRTQVVQIKDTYKTELRTLFPLLPLAAVTLNRDISSLIVAFDATLEAGAVTKTVLGRDLARSFWTQAQTQRCSTNIAPNQELPLVKLVSKTYPWEKALVHQWARTEHINGLEAAAAVLALESAIRAGVHDQRLIMLTDSLVVLGALQKGRSSAPNLLVLCRTFAALALAHNIRVTLVYVKSANNPADPYKRSTKRSADQAMPAAERHNLNKRICFGTEWTTTINIHNFMLN